ncbi:OsmC family protein [Mucilaginibacter sp. UR6-1]|uniref:OsmC family protein n=1 Tax=Mucilaginibacter sp. UR6-1 TaxID=1435643 RepID=UPI001E30C786|nr:OsmC family protein [Mucilaginibacter sp. UR6-1]MCC8407812.1 OsmC family protein [Mucilaginibacter sp. UR6-1]
MRYILEKPVHGVIGSAKFLTSVHWRNGVLITDEPERTGGKDVGPDPFTLLLTSLVSCTLATLRMYSDHKELGIKEIRAEANMYQTLGNEGAVTHIERRVFIPEVSDPELQQRLMRVAENCPVSKILKGSILIGSAFLPLSADAGPLGDDTDPETI